MRELREEVLLLLFEMMSDNFLWRFKVVLSKHKKNQNLKWNLFLRKINIKPACKSIEMFKISKDKLLLIIDEV